MIAQRVVTENMLQEARLGGIPCSAYAYVEVTHVEVPAGERGQTQIVDGVRTWRGKAVVEDPAFLAQRRHDKAIRYEGVLHDGDEQRQICADVYVYYTRRARMPPPSPYERGEASRDLIYVAFVGAGNNQLH